MFFFIYYYELSRCDNIILTHYSFLTREIAYIYTLVVRNGQPGMRTNLVTPADGQSVSQCYDPNYYVLDLCQL